jgi:WD40 repeat protein
VVPLFRQASAAGPVVLVAVGETVRLWDAGTGELLGPAYDRHRRTVTDVAAVAVHGRALAVSCDEGGEVHAWQVDPPLPLGPPLAGHRLMLWSVAAAAPHGQAVVASAGVDATIRFHDPFTRAELAVSAGLPGTLDTTDPEDPRFWEPRWDLLTGSLLDPRTGEAMDATSGPGHSGPVYGLAAATLADRTVVASAGADRTVRVWDAATGEAVGDPYLGHEDSVWSVAVAEVDGRPVAVSAGSDRTVHLWDLVTRRPLAEPGTGHESVVWSVATGHCDGRRAAASAAADGTVRVWDLSTGRPLGRPYTGHRDDVQRVRLTRLSGRDVAVSSDEAGEVHVWDVATRRPVRKPYRVAGEPVRALAVVPG